MKAMIKIYATTLLIFLLTIFSTFGKKPTNPGNGNNGGGGNDTYTSVMDGLWNSGNTWGVQNNKAPGNALAANTDVVISSGNEVDTENNYNITLNSQGANGGTITIFGTLIINGNLLVDGMNWIINVEEGGVFIINGDVHFGTQNGDQHPNQTSLTINGDVHVDGDFSGHGDVDGVGNLYVEGDLNEGINTTGFSGVIAEDIPNMEIPAPVMWSVARDGSNHRMFFLEWNDDYNTEVQYVIDGVDYEFAGFRIVRNLDGMNHSEQIIRGYFMEYINEDDELIFEGFDNSVMQTNYIDVISNEDIEGIDGDIFPEYYVRAVYVKSGAEKSLLKSDYIFSANSNLRESESPLPIELLHFSAQPASDEVVVEWSTAAEINNDFFTVERSIDGNSWETLTYINGAGNANYVINYSYTDNNPIDGVSYYRLKQTDFDGQYEYFAPAAVNFSSFVSSAEIIRVVPSAQNMEVWFQNQDPNAILTVADMQGRILHNSNARVADFVQQISINLPRNYSGEVVMVNLRTNDKTDQVKLIVR